MLISLLAVDSPYPNLALMKLAAPPAAAYCAMPLRGMANKIPR